MNRRRDEVVTERVHPKKRCRLRRVAEVVLDFTLCERWADVGFNGNERSFATARLGIVIEGKCDSAEVRSAADAADDRVRIGARLLHLELRLKADDRLMKEHVVEDASERVLGRLSFHGLLDRFGDRDAERTGRVRIGVENRPSGCGSV